MNITQRSLDGMGAISQLVKMLISGDAYYAFFQGPIAFFEHLRNVRRLWNPRIAIPSSPGTSVSDNLPYAEFCELATTDPMAFSKFKSALPYRTVLEHSGLRNGKFYASALEKASLSVDQSFLNFHSKLGNPEVFTFKNYGTISPSLLRYMKVVLDLNLYFPKWKNMDVLEIGIGYGGQLCVLRELGHSGSYSGVDLLSVTRLASQYLKASGLFGDDIVLIDGVDASESTGAGLFLSNYAFCELIPEVQEQYFELYVSKCTNGYVTWNDLSEKTLGGMTAREFADRVGGTLIPDPVPTYADNLIIIWGPGHSK
jgi:hypothetical protein